MGKMYEINAFIEVADGSLDNLIARETTSDKRQAMKIAKELKIDWKRLYETV